MDQSKEYSQQFKKKQPISSTKGFILVLVVAAFGIIAFVCTTAFSSAHTNSSPSRSTSHYWSMPDKAFYQVRSAYTDSRTFSVGNTVVMPNGLALQVTRIQRNWQPPVVVATSITGQTQGGDNPEGREIILVWFNAHNVGNAPVIYNDSMFTLQQTGKSEQRIAHLMTLLPSAYGSHGVEPWLLPGQSVLTFVPFLVTPNGKLQSFQYYPISLPLQGSKKLSILTRLSISLQSLQPAQASATSTTFRVFDFKEDRTISVGE